MKCPVCDNVNRSMVCLRCGFDASRDYEGFPTFGAVGEASSASALRREWRQNHPAEEPVNIPTPPQPEPPRKKKPWLLAAAAAAILILGIGIGTGLDGGKMEPAEPKETVQAQTQPEHAADHDRWRNNILRSDEVVDADADGMYNIDEARGTPVFGSDYQRSQIRSVTFLDTLTAQPDDAWDVSEAGDGAVKAWVKPSGELYDLYIGAEGGVHAGKSCRGLFMGYENLERISFGDAFHTDGTEDMSDLFHDCYTLSSLDLSNFDTSDVTDMGDMFFFCKSLNSLDLNGFDTSNVQSMSYMFYECSGMTWLNLSSFDTSKVQNMGYMFYKCTRLTNLDLSSFDTSGVRDVEKMFAECVSLNSLKLSDAFVTTNADMTDMFTNCPAGDDYQHLDH